MSSFDRPGPFGPPMTLGRWVGSPSAPARRRPVAAFLLVAVLAGAAPTTAQVASASPLAAYALAELQRLATARERVDPENVSRYFAVYPLPTDQGEARRLLGTMERVVRGLAAALYRAAEAAARERGATTIGPEAVRAAVAGRLPREATTFDTVVFFPAAAPAERIEVETIDLEAIRGTPLAWSALVGLSAEVQGAMPMAAEAVPELADAVGATALLVLRTAGVVAERERALELASPHLREAAKALEALASGAPSGLGTSPAAMAHPGPTPFVDVTRAAGIRFRHVSSAWISRFRRYGIFAPSFSGGGVSAGDLDGDGWPDLVFCGGRGCAAYRNRGDGRFDDVTAASGLAVDGEARMAVVADLDGDGDEDVFVTYARDPSRLFEGLGGGRFREVGEAAGLARAGDLAGPAVAFDYDRDGRLDLYVANFGDYLHGEDPWRAADNKNGQPNRLFRNLGGLRFEETTERSGTGDTGWAQAVAAVDFDRDGWQDLYVANDFGRNQLFRNRGDGSFEAAGARTGSDDPHHGMNVAFADLDRDLLPDLLVTNIWGWLPGESGPGEHNTLLRSRRGDDGGVVYESDLEIIPDLVAHDTGWSWAGLFFDADSDGDDDLMLLNGHTDYATFLQFRPRPDRPDALYPIHNGREPNVFFRNDAGILRVAPGTSGAELPQANSRALALLDYDRDGDLDLAVTTFHGEAHLFRNDAPPPGAHWLSVELAGDPAAGSSRQAIGAQLVARGEGGLQVWRGLSAGEGYLGQSAKPLALGLGAATAVDLEIAWPSGAIQHVEAVPADRFVRVREGVEGFETLAAPAPAGIGR